MIVRIQGEGQWELDQAQVAQLDKIDNEMVAVVGANDTERFGALLAEMLDYVRKNGRKLAPDEIAESTLILPPADATLEEVRELFQDEGLLSV
jgi:hypothetical protein